MADGRMEGMLQKIIVPVVIALLVGGTSPWWWNQIIHREPSSVSTTPTSAATSASITPATHFTSPIVTATPSTPLITLTGTSTRVQDGPIQVQCSASPYSIRAGGQVEISILAFTKQGSPISGANVRIESGGGWFSRSGTSTEIGQTDTGGVFRTQWRSPTPAAAAYVMAVYVTKIGFTEGTCEFTVRIQ